MKRTEATKDQPISMWHVSLNLLIPAVEVRSIDNRYFVLPSTPA